MTTTVIVAEPCFQVVTARVAKLTPGVPADDLVTIESWPVVAWIVDLSADIRTIPLTAIDLINQAICAGRAYALHDTKRDVYIFEGNSYGCNNNHETIKELLHERGGTLPSSYVEPPCAAVRQEPGDVDGTTWEQIVRSAEANADRLSLWERDLISNVKSSLHHGIAPTAKQMAALEMIFRIRLRGKVG